MPQFVRPNADASVGSWTTTPLWTKVDEGNPGDGVTIESGDVLSSCVFSCSAVVDPQASTDHIIRVRWRKDLSGGNDIIASVYLVQGNPAAGGTYLAELTINPITDTTLTTYTYTLSAAQADAITEYDNLFLEIDRQGQTGGGGSLERSLIVDFVELEVPDVGAASGTGAQTIDDPTQSFDGTASDVIGSAAQTIGSVGGGTSRFLLEDGTSLELLEDGSFELIDDGIVPTSSLTQSASGSTADETAGVGAQTVLPLEQTATAGEEIPATAAQTISLFSQNANAFQGEAPVGTGVQSVPQLVQEADSKAHHPGDGSQTVAAPTQTADVLHIEDSAGTGAQSTATPIQSAFGGHGDDVSGTGSQSLILPTQLGESEEVIPGTGAQTLELLSQDGVGDEVFATDGAQIIPFPTQQGSDFTPGAQIILFPTQVGVAEEIMTGNAAQTVPDVFQTAFSIEPPIPTGYLFKVPRAIGYWTFKVRRAR